MTWLARVTRMGRRVPALVALGWALAGAPMPLAAQGDRWTESARQALADRGTYPWYDAQRDGLQPRSLTVQPTPRGPERWSRRSRWNWRGPSWDRFWDLIKYGVWMLLAGLLVWLVYAFARAFWQRDKLAAERMRDQMRRMHGDAERIERLPYELAAETLDLLALAQQAYDQGHYDRAMVFLFSYLLVELDRAHFVRLARGKTNRQYLAELRGHQELRSILESAMVPFEEVFFGKRRLEPARFEACWTRLTAFRRLVQPSSEGEAS